MHPAFRRRIFRASPTSLAAALLILLLSTLSAPLAQDEVPPPAPGQDIYEWAARITPTGAWTFYPDDQLIADFSGYLEITINAGGSFDLPANEPGDRNSVSCEFQASIAYTTFGGHEETLVNLHSEVVETMFRAERGVDNQGHLSYYRPQRVRRNVSRITGGSMAAAPLRIANLHFSPSMKLSSFQMQMGPMEARNQITGLTWELETWEDGELTDRQETGTAFFPRVPSGGAAPSRWALAVAGPMPRQLAGMTMFYYESSSVNGETTGSLVFPIYTDGQLMVAPPETWKAEKGIDPAAPPQRASSALFPGTAEVRWSFVTQADPGEMTIEPTEPAAYERWMPVPMPDDHTIAPLMPGDGDDHTIAPLVPEDVDDHTIAPLVPLDPEIVVLDDPEAFVTAFGIARPLLVTASIKPKQGDRVAPKGRIHFYLRDVSRHRGICNNYPHGGGDTEPDLFFIPRPGIIIDPNDPMHAYSENYLSELTVAIGARDTAAYGVVQAYCDDLGLVAKNERTQRYGLVVPLDDNQNRIADTWEHDMRLRDVLGHQDLAGDGLTVFEAYRGFVTPGGFVRPDPRARIR